MEAYTPEIENYFVLVYGGSGSGKTHLTSTLGELGKVLNIDADLGGTTIVTAPTLADYRKNITLAKFRAFRDIDQVAKLIDKNDPDAWNKAVEGMNVTEPFDWFVFDTWTEIQWIMMVELRKNADRSGAGRLDFRKNIEIQHWGQLTDLNKLCTETFRDMGKNIVFNMQEVIVHDDVSGFTYGGPAIHGKMVKEMPAYFNAVIHTTNTATGAFQASTKRKGFFDAKTRYGVGKEETNPTMKSMLDID